MNKVLVVFEKEFSDIIKSKRLWVILALYVLFYIMALSFLVTTFQNLPVKAITIALSNVSGTLSFMAPAIGIALGFDAISGEYEKGTIRVVLAQPIFRDSFIIGKFLAATTAIAISIFSATAIVISAAIIMLGLTVTFEDVVRLILVIIFSILLSLAYYAISVLFSIVLKKSSHSAILSISLLIIFLLILPLVANLIARAVVGPPPRIRVHVGPGGKVSQEALKKMREYWAKVNRIRESVLMFSINYHYNKICNAILRTPPKLQNISIDALISNAISANIVSVVTLVIVTIVFLLSSFMIFVKSELK